MDKPNIRPNYRVHRIDCCENCKYSEWGDVDEVWLCKIDEKEYDDYDGAWDCDNLGICDNYKRRER